MSGNDFKSNEGGKELVAAVDVIVAILVTRKNQEISGSFVLSNHEIC